MGSRLEKNSESVRKRIANHTFDDEDGEEYGGSTFGGFNDYFRRKKTKLQNLDADIRARVTDKPQIFKGIVAHVNGYTQPSLNDLHMLIVEHGGGFMQYLDGKTTVTHVVASTLTPKKAVEFRKYRIVKPAWVVDSIRARKLLPWNDYRVVDEGDKQNVLAFDKTKGMMSQANIKPRSYRDQTDASWYTSQLRTSQSWPVSSPTPADRAHLQFAGEKPTNSDEHIEDLPFVHLSDQLVHPAPQSSFSRGVKTTTDLGTPRKTIPAPLEKKTRERPSHEIEPASAHSCEVLFADALPPLAEFPQYGNDTHIEEDKNRTRSYKERQLTAEEHNAILLRDPKIRKSTVVDPDFLEQYYRESRLHHLSTWKADLKSQLQALASERSSSQKAKHIRIPGARRYILHVDFDSFFAAVSLKKDPEYKDKPAVVAHGQGSGSEIASCNYPARKFGIKNGMWMKRALELCPNVKILPYDFPAYEDASRAFYDAVLATGGIVQSVSVDEALVDISNLCIDVGGADGRASSEGSIHREQVEADRIAQSVRDAVRAKTGCEVSVGIGCNILLAKVALRKAKPAGQYQIKPEEVLDFIGELQVQELPGVAWSIGGKLGEIGVKYVRDIRELSKERLVQTLGPKTGEKLYEYARGIDRQVVGEQVIRKSVSAEVNWGVRFENQTQADEFIVNLCGELERRLIKEKVKGKQFTMKIMRRSADAPLDPPKHLGHGKCDTYNKSLVLGVATNSKTIFTREALAILRGFGFTPGELRGIGIQMTKLEPMKTASDGNPEGSQRRLQFKASTSKSTGVRNLPKMLAEDSIHDDAPPKELQDTDRDPIQDDPETPGKLKGSNDENKITFGAEQLNHSTPSRRPLNILGTQFILPTQVDPKVLAELPEDIRSKLLRQSRPGSPDVGVDITQEENHTRSPYGSNNSRNQMRDLPFAMAALPARSQLDPDILAALPPDVRFEVLAQYDADQTPLSPSRRPRNADQTLLPQSPRKNRLIGIPANKPTVPAKRGRGRPPRSAMLAAAAQAKSVSKTGKTLTQANFISLKNSARDSRSRETSAGPVSADETPIYPAIEQNDDNHDDLDPEFLSALPEDMRKEIMEEHKLKRLQASRLAMSRKPNMSALAAPVPPKPTRVIKVSRPQKPTFTTSKFSREQDLRQAMKDWVREFSDEGPYEEDVIALVKYLSRVVVDEKDMRKAVGVVQWLEYVIEDAADGRELEGKKWCSAVITVKTGVCKAARERGIGVVSFE